MTKNNENNKKCKCEKDNQWAGVDKQSGSFTGKKNKSEVNNEWTSTIKNSHE